MKGRGMYLLTAMGALAFINGWRLFMEVHVLLPIGLLLSVFAVAVIFAATSDERKRARSDRIFNEMCDEEERRASQRRQEIRHESEG